MDWGDSADIFAEAKDFVVGSDPKVKSEACVVERNYHYYTTDGKYERVEDERDLGLDPSMWEKLSKGLGNSPGQELSREQWPRDGYCILFIPRAADTGFFHNLVPSDFMTLPIQEAKWENVLPSLYLPQHYTKIMERGISSVVSIHRSSNDGNQERLYMQIGATPPETTQGFAFASTHFTSRRFTSAVLIGCSEKQIKHAKKLVSSFKDSHKHPFLMFALFTELELRRLEESVNTLKTEYYKLKTELLLAGDKEAVDHLPRGIYLKRILSMLSWGALKTFVLTHNQGQTTEGKVEASKRQPEFSWDMIKRVLSTRDSLQETEEEVEVSKRQIEKVCKQVDELWDEYKQGNGGEESEGTIQGNTPDSTQTSAQNSPHGNNQDEEAKKKILEVTQLFSERIHDIVYRLSGLSSQCRLRADSISFWTELIRSELARQEANISSRNTKIGTLVAFVALVYLPVTGVATVLATPIFGWANDWKDLHFNSVHANDNPNGSPADSGSAGATSTGLPVVSGYVWIWAIVSAVLLPATIAPLIIAARDHGGGRQPRGADTVRESPLRGAGTVRKSPLGGAALRRIFPISFTRSLFARLRANSDRESGISLSTLPSRAPSPDTGIADSDPSAALTPAIGPASTLHEVVVQ